MRLKGESAITYLIKAIQLTDINIGPNYTYFYFINQRSGANEFKDGITWYHHNNTSTHSKN
jgi:hypothetical protein